MKPHQNERKIRRNDFTSEHILYENGDNYIFATFISWKNDYATHISVRSNFLKIKKAYFCPTLDQLEVSGIQGITSQPYISQLEDCYINREEVIVIQYNSKEEYEQNKYECFVPDDSTPDVKKGNILVGG